MNAHNAMSKLLSVSKLFVFIFLVTLSCRVSAAYYVEAEPVPVVACDSCSRYSTTYVYYPQRHYYHHVRHHRTYYHPVTHKRRSHYSIEVYYVWHVPPLPPVCGCNSICNTSYSCNSCSPCGGGCRVSGCHRKVYYQPEVVYTPGPNTYDDTPDYDTRTADDFDE